MAARAGQEQMGIGLCPMEPGLLTMGQTRQGLGSTCLTLHCPPHQGLLHVIKWTPVIVSVALLGGQ